MSLNLMSQSSAALITNVMSLWYSMTGNIADVWFWVMVCWYHLTGITWLLFQSEECAMEGFSLLF